jgi:D-amino-acid dehydrogenase
VDAGARVVEQTDVIRVQPGGPGTRASVLTSRGEISAGQVVIAAGSWSPRIAAGLDLRLPVQAAKGYSITFSSPSWRPRRPVNLGEARAVATPLPHGVRIGGTLELAGLDRSITVRRVQAILEGAARVVPGARFDAGAADAEVWHGLRPLSPDTLPIIGRPRAHPNVVLATAHGTLGVSLGPATGEAVAALIGGSRPAVDLHPYRPDRFA